MGHSKMTIGTKWGCSFVCCVAKIPASHWARGDAETAVAGSTGGVLMVPLRTARHRQSYCTTVLVVEEAYPQER